MDQSLNDASVHCCADCSGVGGEGGISLKACKACMLVRYCSPACQQNHWPKHKKECKLCAAKLRDKVLFKDPPAKEDCPICFLPMPIKWICSFSLLPTTILSVPIYNFAIANNEEVVNKNTEMYYECCGKSICRGCFHSFRKSGNMMNCPFCNADRIDITDEEMVAGMMKRAEANDPGAICQLGCYNYHGQLGMQEDQERAIELYTRAADLGSSRSQFQLGAYYHARGDSKKEKFHYEAAAMAGHEVARFNLGYIEYKSGNVERAVKHWTIAASAGHHTAMHNLLGAFNHGLVRRESINSTLTAYNNSCAEMRSEARDAAIHADIGLSINEQL